MSKGVVNEKAKDLLPKPTMKTITTQNQPDLDHSNRFYKDNLQALDEIKVHITAKQEAENRLVIRKYNEAKEL